MEGVGQGWFKLPMAHFPPHTHIWSSVPPPLPFTPETVPRSCCGSCWAAARDPGPILPEARLKWPRPKAAQGEKDRDELQYLELLSFSPFQGVLPWAVSSSDSPSGKPGVSWNPGWLLGPLSQPSGPAWSFCSTLDRAPTLSQVIPQETWRSLQTAGSAHCEKYTGLRIRF